MIFTSPHDRDTFEEHAVDDELDARREASHDVEVKGYPHPRRRKNFRLAMTHWVYCHTCEATISEATSEAVADAVADTHRIARGSV